MAMDTLRSVAHLQKELGDRLFNVLISSDHTASVREFVKKLDEIVIPTTMTIGHRTYKISCLLENGERLRGGLVVDRANEKKAHLGDDDGEYIFEYRDSIPFALRGKVTFVFTDWRLVGSLERVVFICWNGRSWVKEWGCLDGAWEGCMCGLRRKS